MTSTVLAVDDNPDNIELLRAIVQGAAGLNFLAATDGPKALDIAKEHKPDIILLDLNMPGMSGIEVVSKLKANPETAKIPVIILTAVTDVDTRVRGLAAGAEDYMTKPYSPRELIARLEARLRAKAETDDLVQRQEMIRKLFSRFVAAPVVDRLLKDPLQVELGGRLQPVTVLFADLEGFTPLCEKNDPQQIISVLNQYHTFIINMIQRYGGTIDKFLGDGVMALYNTPLEQEDHIARAVKTALHTQDELYHFHQKMDPVFRVPVNFGIHTGMAVVGNVGAAEIMDFTAVGDTVNVAARLQSHSRNGQILISKDVYDAVEDFVVAREIGPIAVKGRSEPIITYEISNSLFL